MLGNLLGLRLGADLWPIVRNLLTHGKRGLRVLVEGLGGVGV